jgi:hypothetical protein
MLAANPPEPAMNYNRRAEDRMEPEGDDTRAAVVEAARSKLMELLQEQARPRQVESSIFSARQRQIEQQARLQEGDDARRVAALQGILGINSAPSPEYKEVGDRILRMNDPNGPSVAWEPPPKEPSWLTLGQGQEAVRPQAGGGYERISGPPRVETPQRPFAVGGQVYRPQQNDWLTPPGGVKPEGLPASVAGRAIDAGIVPVPPDDPNYALYQRVIAGTASRQEQQLMNAANQQWARAYQDRLESLGKFSFGTAPSEADYEDAKAHANRVRSDYMRQAQAGSAQPNVRPDVEARESQLRQEHPEWTSEQIDDALLAEGY